MLSVKALVWLDNMEYADRNHEERMELLKIAKEVFPADDEEPTDSGD